MTKSQALAQAVKATEAAHPDWSYEKVTGFYAGFEAGFDGEPASVTEASHPEWSYDKVTGFYAGFAAGTEARG